jgi:aspartate racemase
MKTIGLLGGMSWESTVTYYQVLNEEVKRRLGGFHSAKIVLYSVDFQEIEACQHEGRWEETAEILGAAAQRVETAGADFLLICANTMHKVAPEIGRKISIPLLHIADATAERIKKRGFQTLGLLGTRYTMEQDFYRKYLRGKHEIDTIIPDQADRDIIHAILYDEVCLGKIEQKSRDAFVRIIESLHDKGAEGVILGCTEIPLVVSQKDTTVPLFDTTQIHAEAAVSLAIA